MIANTQTPKPARGSPRLNADGTPLMKPVSIASAGTIGDGVTMSLDCICTAAPHAAIVVFFCALLLPVWLPPLLHS
jgi:hypothetical protein